MSEWRVGTHYAIHVYEDQRPVATFLTAFDARAAVRDHNAATLNVPQDGREGGSNATKPAAGTPGHPDPAQAQEERRARWEHVVTEWEYDPNPIEDYDVPLADACMALADAEQSDLKVEHLALNAACGKAFDRLRQADAEAERLRAEVERLLAELADLQAEVAEVKAEADRYARSWNEAEDDLIEARATIDRVKALVRPLGILYAALPDGLYALRCKLILDDLRAALDAPPPRGNLDEDNTRDQRDEFGGWTDAEPVCSTCEQPMDSGLVEQPGVSAQDEADRYAPRPTAAPDAAHDHAATRARILEAARRMEPTP